MGQTEKDTDFIRCSGFTGLYPVNSASRTPHLECSTGNGRLRGWCVESDNRHAKEQARPPTRGEEDPEPKYDILTKRPLSGTSIRCLVPRRFQRNSGRFSKGHHDSFADVHLLQPGRISHARNDRLTKAFNDSYEKVRKVHSSMETYEIKDGPTGCGVPLHPGAIKYYKEKGLLK